jgi:hypothetical protein
MHQKHTRQLIWVLILIFGGSAYANGQIPKEGNSSPDKGADLYSAHWWNEWNIVNPFDFMELLKKNPNIPVYLHDAPKNWIRRDHIDRLVSLLHSTVPVSATAYLASAHAPPKGYHSTVGREAGRMIESYRTGLSYPIDFSDLAQIDVQEIEKWWHEQKKE